jgi:hypothetical protein
MKLTRLVISTLSSAILVASFGNVFANNIKCPSTDVIKKTMFKSAYMKDDKGDQWDLVSGSFNYGGNQFNVSMYIIDVIHTKWQIAALKEGQVFFNQATLYSKPYQEKPDTGGGVNYIHCKYWEGQGGYYVEASTPPYPYP